MTIVMRPPAIDLEVQAVIDRVQNAATVAGKALWEEPAATRSAVPR